MFDDTINIQLNPYIQIKELTGASLWQGAMSGYAGALKRPVSMASFALNYYFSGLDPYVFKVVNLALHLVNGVLLYLFIRLLLGMKSLVEGIPLQASTIEWAALVTTALWLLHPLNLTSVLYVVQRMTELAALFMLVGLVLYLQGRKLLWLGKRSGWLLVLVAILAVTPFAALSKENGLLQPFLILVLEVIVLKYRLPDPVSSHRLKMFLALLIVVPILLACVFLASNPAFVTRGYEIRNFDLPQRLMTEARVLWLYLRLLLVPDIALMGFHHDDLEISKGLLAPPSTLLAMLGLLALAALSWICRERYPLLVFGIVFFFVGHLFESTIFALEIAYEHRNYLPTIGLLGGIVCEVFSRSSSASGYRAKKIGVIGFIVLIAGVTFLRTSHWTNPMELKLMEVHHHPRSVRAHVEYAAFLSGTRSNTLEQAKSNYEQAMFHFEQASRLSETDTSGLFGIVGVKWERGFPIDQHAVNILAKRLETVPFAPSSANSLMALGKCQFIGRCKNNEELMNGLLTAALRNSTLKGKEKAMVLFTYSDYLSIVQNREEEAIRMARLAMAASPSILEHRFVLVKILINLGHLDEASRELDITRRSKGAVSYGPVIQELEETITRIKKGH